MIDKPLVKKIKVKAERLLQLLTVGFMETIDLIWNGFVKRTSLFKLLSSMSIRYKLAGTITILLALTVSSLGFVTFTHQTTILRQELQNRAEVLVQQLAGAGKEGILTKQELHVYSTIAEIQQKSGVAYAMVLDPQGTIFIHSVLGMKGKNLYGKIDQMALSTQELLFQETRYDGHPVLDATYPIIHKPTNIKIGIARIGLSEEALQAAIGRQKTIFFWLSLGFIIIGLLLSFWLARILTRSICTLEEGMKRVALGDFSRQVTVSYRDEIGRLTEVFNQMLLGLREKLHMEKYLSRSTVKSIKKNRDISQLRLGGKKKYVTTLFSDVRGFTSLSERMMPEEVVKLLNIYLNLQGKVIRQWGGVVDKFIGDEVMAIFEGPGAELNAVRSAVEIQRYCESLNWVRAKTGRKQLQIGIGMNSGEVVMGNMGSEEQMDYTVIGDTVNVAARLCNMAQPGQIVISKVIADHIQMEASMTTLEPVMVKGKDKLLEVFNVTDVTGLTRKYMRQALEAPAVYYFAGMPGDTGRAIVKNISPSGGLLEVPAPVPVGSTLCLEIEHPCFKGLHITATVQQVRKQYAKHYAGVKFQELDDASRCSIITWIHEIETDIIDTKAPQKTVEVF